MLIKSLMGSLRCRFFPLTTILLLCAWGVGMNIQAQNVADLRLVPFPKEVKEPELRFSLEQRFSLKAALELFISEEQKDILGTAILDELKHAGFPEPQLVIAHPNAFRYMSEEFQNEFRVIFTIPGSPLAISPLPEQAGEGKSDIGESYAISILPEGIYCRSKSEIGLHYAVQTLRQLIRANTDADGTLPCLTICDHPSMKYRCFQDDWTRGPSPYLQTIFNQFDLGSFLKHNMFTYYMENQFEYKKHPKLNPKDGTLTQEEFKQSVEYAAKRHLIVLGNQQSFGHHYKTLAVPEYAHLGEAGYILSPAVEEVYTFLDDLYSEILPLVPFEMFNVCCDETWDLAKSGPSKELADEIGVAGVYIRHILRVRELLKKYNKRMLMWGDIIMNHPDKLDLIPKDVVMMCWWYEPLPDFDSFIKPFSESGYDFFICPGLSNWSVMLPQVRKYMVNIQNFVRDGCNNGAIGMLNTCWEDDGEALHGYNWHAIAWGAECSWNASKTDPANFNKRIGPVLFGAKGDDFGRAIELLAELQVSPELGSTYNGRFWDRDFIPQQPAAIVEKKAKRILELVRPAIDFLEITQKQATVNAELLDSFLFGARRMELIATRMLDGLEVSRRYGATSALDLTNPAQKKTAMDELETINNIIDSNRQSHRAFKAEFVRIWNSESKPFSLDRVTQKYDDLDEWFAGLQQKVRDVQKAAAEGATDAVLPDIGLTTGFLMRKTSPSRVETRKLSPETSWANPHALMRLGLTIASGNVDRMTFPVELDVILPESCIGKKVEAFVSGGDVPTSQPIPAQLDSVMHPKNPKIQRLTLMLPGMKKGTTTDIYVYFGLDKVGTSSSSLSTFDDEHGMKVIANDLVQIHLGAEGGHAYKWLVRDRNDLDMTDPGDSSYHGFCDHGHAERSKKFDLVCMNDGPAMVRYGCFFDGELLKTLTVYAGLPVIDVVMTEPTGYFWNMDDPDLFAADGTTPGTFLFSNGNTGPTSVKGNSNSLQTREHGVFWAIKTNEQGLVHGMVTPEGASDFVIGPGGGMGGVGIESADARSHFVTYAGSLTKELPASMMDKVRDTYDLKNQPVIIQYGQESP